MSEAIWVAVIGAFASIAAAIIAVRYRPQPTMLDAPREVPPLGTVGGAGADPWQAPALTTPRELPPPSERSSAARAVSPGLGPVASLPVSREVVTTVEPSETVLSIVRTREELEDNLNRLEAYLLGDDEGLRTWAKQLLRKAKCVVISRCGGRVRFGPSRFVGYQGNTQQRHESFEDKDGKETNPAISGILGQQPVEDSTLENEFREFCRVRQIENLARVSRKYWDAG